MSSDFWWHYWVRTALSALATVVVGTALAAVLIAAVSRTRQDPTRRIVKSCRVLAAVLFGVGMIGVIAGLILTVGATAAPGLTESDRTRMWSNGLAEAVFNFAFGAFLAAPAFALSQVVARRGKQSST